MPLQALKKIHNSGDPIMISKRYKGTEKTEYVLSHFKSRDIIHSMINFVALVDVYFAIISTLINDVKYIFH